MKVALPYIGRRFVNDKILYVFLDGEERISFAKVRCVTIGCHYLLTKLGETYTINRYPDQDESKNSKERQVDLWQAEDASAMEMSYRKKSESRMNKHPALDEAVRAIKPLLKGAHPLEYSSLVRAIIRKATKE